MRGKAAFITGAGSGIGRATARRFAEEGAAAMAADVVADRADETARMLSDDGLNARSVCVDVTDARAVEDGAPDGIRVNCICPGFVQTPMIDGYWSGGNDS